MNPLAEHPFERMLAPANVVFHIEWFQRGRSLVGRFVSLVAIEYLDNIELIFHRDISDRSLDQENVFLVDDLEAVPVGILDVVVVENSGAVCFPRDKADSSGRFPYDSGNRGMVDLPGLGWSDRERLAPCEHYQSRSG